MRRALVHGVGITQMRKHRDKTLADLGREAADATLADGCVEPDAVDAIYCGNVYEVMGAGQQVAKELGLLGLPIVNVENACASGSTAIHEARRAITEGRYETVLVLGVEHMSSSLSGPVAFDVETDLNAGVGQIMPAVYAMRAMRHMLEHGTTDQQLASVTLKSRANAAKNSVAQLRNETTIEEVLGSRMISSPITLMQCCPTGDGAAAVLLSSKSSDRAVSVSACALQSGRPTSARRSAAAPNEIMARTASLAYSEANVEPGDIDVAEVHDAFTIGEILALEGLGFCPEGEGGRFTESGATALDGEVAINPSGGLLSKGHPLGATGVAQIVELVQQLRVEAGKRQVAGARIGLAETVGGGVSGVDANACAVTILEA